MKKLLEFYDPDQLEQRFGGKAPNVTKYYPPEKFQPSATYAAKVSKNRVQIQNAQQNMITIGNNTISKELSKQDSSSALESQFRSSQNTDMFQKVVLPSQNTYGSKSVIQKKIFTDNQRNSSNQFTSNRDSKINQQSYTYQIQQPYQPQQQYQNTVTKYSIVNGVQREKQNQIDDLQYQEDRVKRSKNIKEQQAKDEQYVDIYQAYEKANKIEGKDPIFYLDKLKNQKYNACSIF